MVRVARAASGGVSFLFLVVVILGVILASFFLIDGFFQLFSDLIVSLIDTIFAGIIAAVAAIAAGIANIIVVLFQLPFEGLANVIIRFVNAIIPGTGADISFVDFTGDGMCIGSGLPPGGDGCTP